MADLTLDENRTTILVATKKLSALTASAPASVDMTLDHGKTRITGTMTAAPAGTPEAGRTSLHRRLQRAESAMQITVDECRRQGVSLGRSLANAAWAKAVAERDEARAELAALRAAPPAVEARETDTPKAFAVIRDATGDVEFVSRIREGAEAVSVVIHKEYRFAQQAAFSVVPLYAAPRALHEDTRRLDWVEKLSASVTPVNDGSRKGRYFTVCGENDEFGEAYDLRAAIDAARSPETGDKP
jgi:hypothetical protein